MKVAAIWNVRRAVDMGQIIGENHIKNTCVGERERWVGRGRGWPQIQQDRQLLVVSLNSNSIYHHLLNYSLFIIRKPRSQWRARFSYNEQINETIVPHEFAGITINLGQYLSWIRYRDSPFLSSANIQIDICSYPDCSMVTTQTPGITNLMKMNG